MDDETFISGISLKDSNGNLLEVTADDDGEVSFNVDGCVFSFRASEVEKVVAVIRDMAQKSLSRVKPEKPEVAKEAVVRSTRGVGSTKQTRSRTECRQR